MDRAHLRIASGQWVFPGHVVLVQINSATALTGWLVCTRLLSNQESGFDDYSESLRLRTTPCHADTGTALAEASELERQLRCSSFYF
jgi:hypothetical protein